MFYLVILTFLQKMQLDVCKKSSFIFSSTYTGVCMYSSPYFHSCAKYYLVSIMILKGRTSLGNIVSFPISFPCCYACFWLRSFSVRNNTFINPLFIRLLTYNCNYNCDYGMAGLRYLVRTAVLLLSWLVGCQWS